MVKVVKSKSHKAKTKSVGYQMPMQPKQVKQMPMAMSKGQFIRGRAQRAK